MFYLTMTKCNIGRKNGCWRDTFPVGCRMGWGEKTGSEDSMGL